MLYASKKSKSKVCHIVQSIYTSKISKANLITFNTINEALKNGYMLSIVSKNYKDKYLNTITNQVRKLCMEKGLKFDINFGLIFIDTKFSRWYFEPSYGKTKLYHKSTKNIKNREYHLQFKKEISASEIVNYIYNHDMNKYVFGLINFAV